MSQPVTFEPGIRYLFQGRGYQVVLILSDGMLVARNLETNALVSQRLAELWHHWQENTLEFAREGPNLDEQATTPLKTRSAFTELADLPPHLQEIARHRYQLIRPLLLLSSRQRAKEVVEARIQTYLSSLNPASAPHAPQPLEPEEHQAMLASSPHLAPFFDITPRTVSRWIRRYQQSHEDIRSLVPSYHQRGPRHHRFSPLLERFLQEAIKETYLTNVRAPVTHVITAFKKRIILENATRPPEEHLLAPGNMTVYRYIQRLDALEVDTARLGKAHAQRKHHQTQLGPLPTRPNQRAELDFARLDLLVVDPNDRLPIGRPTIAAIRDKYTGYPLGVFISFDPPSYRVAMECMLYAFLPKEHVQTQFHTQHAYLAFGIPEVLVVDNAMELDRDARAGVLAAGH